MTSTRLALVVLLCVSSLLVFWNLDNRFLWDDEAETALLAQNILSFGLPRGFDGKDLISQQCGEDLTADYLWTWSPWLQFYTAALSFKMAGASTFSARLPFAVVGLLCLLSVYFLARLLFRDRSIALLAVIILMLSVPFLLHVRQCRYYSLSILGGIWSLYFYFALLAFRRWAGPGLVLSLTFLFHANYLSFLATAPSLGAGYLLFHLEKKTFRPLAVVGIVTALINGPWLVLFDVVGKSRVTHPSWSFQGGLLEYFAQIDLYVLPLSAMIFLGGWHFLKNRDFGIARTDSRRLLFLLFFCAANLVFLATLPFVFFRYQLHLLPVFALIQAFLLGSFLRRYRLAAVGLTALILATGFFHGWTLPLIAPSSSPSAPRFPLAQYLKEITHDFDGPIEGITNYLRREAKPGDRVYISYGDLPLRFYTDLEVRGGLGCQELEEWPAPDWIIVRYFFRFTPPIPKAEEEHQRTLTYLQEKIPWQDYQAIELPHVDTIWENIPEPPLHVFLTPQQGRRVIIHRKRAATGGERAAVRKALNPTQP